MLPTLIAAILNCRVSFRVIRPVLLHPTDVAKQSVKRSQEWAWREVEISRRCRQDDRRRAGQRARGWRQNDDVRPGTTGEGGRVHGGCVEWPPSSGVQARQQGLHGGYGFWGGGKGGGGGGGGRLSQK